MTIRLCRSSVSASDGFPDTPELSGLALVQLFVQRHECRLGVRNSLFRYAADRSAIWSQAVKLCRYVRSEPHS